MKMIFERDWCIFVAIFSRIDVFEIVHLLRRWAFNELIDLFQSF